MPVAARAKTVGKPAALDMALRGKLLDADEAERIGLIHQACATVEELEEATLELALELGGKAPLAMQGVLQAIMEGSVRSPPTDHPFRCKPWATCRLGYVLVACCATVARHKPKPCTVAHA